MLEEIWWTRGMVPNNVNRLLLKVSQFSLKLFCSVVVFKQINIIYMDILATNSNNTTTCHLNFMYKPSVVSCGAAEWFFIAISVAYHSHVHGRLYSLMILSKPPLIYSLSQQGAHLGSTGPRWAPYWPHESCYQKCSFSECSLRYSRSEQIGRSIADKIFMYIFLAGNSVYSNFTELCFFLSNWQYISIGSWNGLGRTEISLLAVLIIT